jgi:hypothetical protein
VLSTAEPASALTLRPGFQEDIVFNGLAEPTAVTETRRSDWQHNARTPAQNAASWSRSRCYLIAPMVSPRTSRFCAIQPAATTGRQASVEAAESLARN